MKLAFHIFQACKRTAGFLLYQACMFSLSTFTCFFTSSPDSKDR